MAILISPGISIVETDLTNVVPNIATTPGGFVGIFEWGPANQPILVSNEQEMVRLFGEPNDDNYEYWLTAANFLSYGNNLKIVRAAGPTCANANPGGVTGSSAQVFNEEDYNYKLTTLQSSTVGPFIAKYPGTLGNSLKVSLCDSPSYYDGSMAVNGSWQLTAGNKTVSGAAASGRLVAGDYFIVGSNTYQIDTVSSDNLLTLKTDALVTVNSSATVKWQYSNLFSSAPRTSDFVAARGGTADEIHVAVVDEDGLWSGASNTVLEVFPFASKALDAKLSDGSSNNFRQVLNNQSKYVWWVADVTSGWTKNSDQTFTPRTILGLTGMHYSFSGGTANNSFPGVSAGNIMRAYDKLADAETVDISLLLAGPANPTVAGYVADIATARLDCLAFISPERSDVVNVSSSATQLTNVLDFRNTQLNRNSSYVVMDSGWKYQYDKYNDKYRWVPLNGDIAGLCVRTDFQADPWFSPAGANRGQIRNVVKLAYNPTQAQRDELFKVGINPVVSLPGTGTILFGDKTLLNKPSSFDRINVRRLFIVLEKAIATAAKFALFEFNDEFTRAQFRNLVEPFLREVRARRGVTDYKVVCDETNNTSQVIDSNNFVADIYVKPSKSINFIRLNFISTPSGVSFEEIAG